MWWTVQDLNLWPLPCEGSALPAELTVREKELLHGPHPAVNQLFHFFLQKPSALGVLGAGIGKATLYHAIITAFINADRLSAQAPDFTVAYFKIKFSGDPVLVTPQHFTGAEFQILPQFTA